RSPNQRPEISVGSQKLFTRGSLKNPVGIFDRASPGYMGSQRTIMRSFACGWAVRMCCRTQLAPMRQVGQVGATRTTSVGSRDAELKMLRSCWMLFSCGGDAVAFGPAPKW